jgi:origin recognition complex subunit 5
MKAAEKKRRKKGGGTALGRARKYRRIQRRLLGPQPFVLMRLLSIFHAIVPHDVAPGGADILTQVATLAALRMLVRAAKAADVLEAGTKWRVNVGWDFILGLARGVRFEIEEFLAE